MQIETSVQKVVQLLLKGEDYEILCPNDEDTWYDFEEVSENPRLIALLSAGTLEAMRKGLVDFVICRGNW
jgi:hypothetical protein